MIQPKHYCTHQCVFDGIGYGKPLDAHPQYKQQHLVYRDNHIGDQRGDSIIFRLQPRLKPVVQCIKNLNSNPVQYNATTASVSGSPRSITATMPMIINALKRLDNPRNSSVVPMVSPSSSG